MLSKEYQEAVFHKEQYLNEDHIHFGYDLLYCFKDENENETWNTNTLIVTLRSNKEAYVFYNVDETYTCYNECDLDPDDPDDDIEDIFDTYYWEQPGDLYTAFIDAINWTGNDKARPHFDTYEELENFTNKAIDAGLVDSLMEVITPQVTDDFRIGYESTLAALEAGVPAEDIFI